MAGRAVSEILAVESILEKISRLELPGTSLQKLMGWSIASGGSIFSPSGNTRTHEQREGSYDIFDITRRIATARSPAQASSRQRPQKVGTVRFTIPRSAETIPLLDAEIHARRVIGGPSAVVDRGGQRYIQNQTEYLAQRFANVVEFQTAALFRGLYSFTQNGEDFEHTFGSGGEIDIDYQIPAGNKSKLDMLGGGDIVATSWSDAAAPIPADILAINSAQVELSGMGVEHIVCSSVVWDHVLNNTAVKAQGGSANVVFEQITRDGAGEFTARLRNSPWLTWHIVDYGLEIWDGSAYTFEKLIPDTIAVFLPEPRSSWTEYILGSEWVTEGPNGIKDLRSGFYPYSYPSYDPSGTNLCAEFNGFPSLTRPKAIAYGTVVY